MRALAGGAVCCGGAELPCASRRTRRGAVPVINRTYESAHPARAPLPWVGSRSALMSRPRLSYGVCVYY